MDCWVGLSPQARWLFHVSAVVSTGVVVLPGLAMLVLPLGLWAGFGWTMVLSVLAVLALLVTINAIVMPTLAWSRWAWWLRENDLLVAQGVIVKRIDALPRARVQHVDIRQGVVDRMFGLVDLHVKTASGGIHIPGLEPHVAEALRDQLVDVHGDDGV